MSENLISSADKWMNSNDFKLDKWNSKYRFIADNHSKVNHEMNHENNQVNPR